MLTFSLAQIVPSQPKHRSQSRTDPTVAPSHRFYRRAVAPICTDSPTIMPAVILENFLAGYIIEICFWPVDANELYEAVMTTEGFAEEMLASAFDYMIQEEKVGRAFMAMAPKLRKLWLENYFTKNM
uniref:Uncharacterized protein n=1 Tax=Fagus sylvatica TaxID=28930 RepID=A0A2N9GJY1_FAGSY